MRAAKTISGSYVLTWLRSAALVGLISSSMAGAIEFDGPFPSRDYPFAVKDSGIEVQVDAATVVEWLDNERVIFSALKPGEPKLQGEQFQAKKDKKEYPGRVVVWNTRTGEIKDLGEGRLWCSYRGFLDMFWMEVDQKSGKQEAFVKSGSYGNEIVKPGGRQGDPPRHRDRHTCVVYDGPPKQSIPDHWLYSLREEDGFIDLGPKRLQPGEKKPNVTLIRPDGARQVLPLSWPSEVQGVWWNDWAGVYLLAQMRYGGSEQPRKPDTLPILYPEGRLELYQVPESYWRQNSTKVAVITRRGFVITNDAIFVGALFPNKLRSGAYLIRDNKVVRLVDWLVGNERVALDNSHRGITVSPDGCKIAFKHGEGDRYRTTHTIKMINVCEGE